MQRAYNSSLVVFLAFVMSLAASLSAAKAQDAPEAGIMSNGDAAVTGFSGTKKQGESSFINTEGASVKVMGLSPSEPASGQVINAPTKFEAFARDVGQVFGVTLDNASPPNIYVTATSAYGLNIVKQGAEGNVEKLSKGAPDATFMAGQFGPDGNAGTIWKIDGKTGAVSKFAQVENSVAGLGNISFDATHYQFFVSDLETGLVHRIAMNGQVIDTFDHGTTGRPSGGLEAVANDPALKADITNPEFDTENADTWGLADVRRRVWGLAFYAGRLYYSPTEGPQIWSVGVKQDGSFAADARIEIQTVPGGFPVSDMLFTSAGQMILAQRGGNFGSVDHSRFHTPGNNSVMRYNRDETGQWVQEPKNYAIGFAPDHKSASGGVGLACGNVLWSTGDALRNDPNMAEQLSRGGELVVHGLQSSKVGDVRPRNTPPVSSWFVDFDGQFNDPEKAGHIGDVAVYRNCQPRAQVEGEPREPVFPPFEERFPGWTPEWTPPDGWIPPVWWPEYPDLRLIKRNAQCKYIGKSLIVRCKFKIIVTNVGSVVYQGKLRVRDNVPANVKYQPLPGGNISWACNQAGGQGTPIACKSVNVQTLLPGHSRTLTLKMTYIGGQNRKRIKNCARLQNIDDFLPNNKDCGYGKPPGPDLKMKKTLNWCAPVGGGTICRYWLDVINVGNAPFTGWMNVKEILPAGSSYLGTYAQSRPGWGCWAFGGNVNCSIFANPLLQGNREWVGVSVFVPIGSPPGVKNCAKINVLGDPPHNNKSCAPVIQPQFAILPAVLDKISCPAGWSKQVDGWQPPKNWEVKIIDGKLGPISCGRPKQDKPTRKYCPKGWNRFPAESSVPKGWKVKIVGKLVCAKPDDYIPPIPLYGPKCDAGHRTISGPNAAPRGWSTYSRSLNSKTVWCARPPRPRPISCRKGETLFTSQLAIPRGWTSRMVVQNRRRVWCAKPGRVIPLPGPVCYDFEKRFRSQYDAPRGWRIRPVTRNGKTIFCGSRSEDLAGPECRKGETRYNNRRQIPPRWRWRTVRRNGQTAYCARRPIVVPGPLCNKGDPQISGPYDAPKGWRAYRRVRNGKTIWCASRVAGPRLKCTPNERQVRDQYSAPRGWQVRARSRNGRTIWCAYRGAVQGPKCISGERRVRDQNSAPRGWRVRARSRNGRTIWCAYRGAVQGPQCVKGERQVRDQNSAPRGWRVRARSRNGRTIWCAYRGAVQGPQCVKGERQVRDQNSAPRGWRVRARSRNGRTIWCAYRGVVQGPRCSGNERTYQSSSQVPRGWNWRRVTRNHRTIICAKPRTSVRPCGHGLVRIAGRCVKRPIICRPGTRKIGNRCVVIRPNPIFCKPGTRKIGNRCVVIRPKPIFCRPGTRKIGNRCVVIRPKPIFCRPGTRKIGNRCVVIRPKPIVCRPGTRRIGNRCVKKISIPKPRLILCAKGFRLHRGRCVKR